MTDGDSSRLVVPPEYELFRRSSRRAAVVSVVCGVLILGAIGGSAWRASVTRV